jgi:putative PIN family toxin of toxin-antitoxin system
VPRIVLDCNVFVSALLSPQGSPAQILDQWADGDFDLVISPLLLAELEKVLSRPKFHASIDRVHIDALLTGLAEDAVLVDDPLNAVWPDPRPRRRLPRGARSEGRRAVHRVGRRPPHPAH